MKRTILVAALLGALTTSGAVFAHGGDHRDAMGTIRAVDAERMTLVVGEDETLTFELTNETSYVRGTEVVSREDVVASERAVVMYEKKDGVYAAVEVKLAPKSG